MDLKGFLMIFIVVMVGLSLLTVISDKTYEATSMPYDSIINESWTLNETSSDTCGITYWPNCNYTLAKTNYVGSLVVHMPNGTTLTENTDYTVNTNDDDAVIVSISNSINTLAMTGQGNAELYGGFDNTTYLNYNKYQDNYVQGGEATRTILGFNTLWFVLFIVLVVLGGVGTYMKKEGLL